MTNTEIFTSILSLCALIISVVIGSLQFKKYFDDRKEATTSRSPNFLFSSVLFNCQFEKFNFPTKYKQPNDSEFILAKRHYTEHEKIKESILSLIINACPKGSTSDKVSLVNFDKVTIDNVGFDAVYFEIKNIIITRQIGDNLHITPSEQNKLIERITTAHPLTIYLSLIINSQSNILDMELMKNSEFLNDKSSETEGELLNSSLDKLADLWKRMDIEIVSKNICNEYYKQTISLFIKNNTYFSEQSPPIHIFSKDINNQN